MSQRCYILGADFSKACGLPLAGELTASIFKYCHDRDAELGPEEFDPQGVKQQQWEFLQFLFPGHDLDTNPPGFEDIIVVFDEWMDYDRACGGDGAPFVEHFRESLMHNLHHLLREQVDGTRKEGRLNQVQSFLRRVHDEQSTIVSSNWDLLVEVAAQDIGIGIAYQKGKEPIKDSIYVAKPHGSINLAELPE
jgi:hypothetical protein